MAVASQVWRHHLDFFLASTCPEQLSHSPSDSESLSPHFAGLWKTQQHLDFFLPNSSLSTVSCVQDTFRDSLFLFAGAFWSLRWRAEVELEGCCCSSSLVSVSVEVPALGEDCLAGSDAIVDGLRLVDWDNDCQNDERLEQAADQLTRERRLFCLQCNQETRILFASSPNQNVHYA